MRAPYGWGALMDHLKEDAMLLTRKQREALKSIFDRQPVYAPTGPYLTRMGPLTYRQFRRLVQPELCGPAVMVPWANMWLGIEPDGYTHS